MKFKVMSIFDSKAEAYNTPIFVAAKGQAIRAFEDQINTEDSEFNKHPEDYTLFYIGEFDSDTGQIISTNPESLGVALEYKRT